MLANFTMTCFRHGGSLPPLMLALLAAAPASAQCREERKGPTLENVYQKGTDVSLSTVRALIDGLKPALSPLRRRGMSTRGSAFPNS